jgi:hypothetical protein
MCCSYMHILYKLIIRSCKVKITYIHFSKNDLHLCKFIFLKELSFVRRQHLLGIHMFNSGPTRYTLYSLFVSSLALHVSGAICTHHQEHNCRVQPCVVYRWKTCRPNDERNKECSVHLFGPEFNIILPRCMEPQTSNLLGTRV